jgi:hypothetical protein
MCLSGIVSILELLLMDLPEESALRKTIITMMESARGRLLLYRIYEHCRSVATPKKGGKLNSMINDYINP